MSTLRVNTIQDTAGSGSPAINGLARAWVNFNGTGTVSIGNSWNVSSVLDLGVGTYQVNFINAMPTANYSSLTNNNWYGLGLIDTVLTTSFRVNIYDSNFTFKDTTNISAAIFR